MIGPSWPAGDRRRIVALGLLLVALPVGASAADRADDQPPGGIVHVTAGEHGTFSRVVLALGAGLRYRTEVEPTGLRIVFPDALVGFDYGEVYPRRRAHRVISAEPALSSDGASLRLGFGCACTARTSIHGGKLVVDVFDTGAGALEAHDSPTAPSEPAPSDPAPFKPARSDSEPRRAEAPPAPQAAARESLPGERSDGQPRPEFLRRVQGVEELEPRAPEQRAAPDRPDFDPEHLQRMLTWAIEHGHLSGASVPEGAAPRSRPDEAAQPGVAAAASRGDPNAPAPADAPAAQATTPGDPAVADPDAPAPADPPAQEAAPRDQVAGPGTACPDGSALDMAALGGEGSFIAERARLQDGLGRALAADRGIADARAALARFYVARLMPHEALAVLDEEEDQGAVAPSHQWLKAAALVLADRASELAAGTLWHVSCEGIDARLWRTVVLAAQGPLPKGALEGHAIAGRLADYPPDLRIELGLRLAEAAIEVQMPEPMVQLLDLVEEAGPAGEARARLLFLRGRLAASRGDFAGAEVSWKAAMALSGEGGLRATLALVAADLERGGLDPAAALADLERLAYDWRGHPLQLRIAQLTAALHEQRGDPARALGVLEEVALSDAGRPAGRAAVRLATDLMQRTYGETPGGVPLDQMTAFWRYEGFVPPGPEGAGVRLALARALLAQSLPGPAIGLLEPLVRGGAHEDDAIELLADAYLGAKQPAEALDLLHAAAGRTSEPRPARNRLAARALAALGRFAEAAGLLHGDTGDGMARQQADYLWKAGLWTEAAAAYRGLLGESADGDADVAQAAIRLAAAAHMARRRALIEEATPALEAAGGGAALSAFAPLPAPVRGRAAVRSSAARLLEQAQGLEQLAGRYGLGTREGQ